MITKRKILYARSRKTDYQISNEDYRTYLDQHLFWFIVSFAFSTFLFFLFFKAQGYEFREALKIKDKLTFYIIVSTMIASYPAIKFVKPFQRLKIKDLNSPRLVYDETALEQFNSYEPAPKALQLTDLVQLSKRAAEVATLITGEQGSGKTVTLDRYHEASIQAGSYSIVHDPKGDYTDKYLSVGEKIAVIAPWLEQTKAIDFGGMIFNKDKNKQDVILDLFLLSFHGTKPEGDSFWYETSYAVLKAICLKLCKEKENNWQELDICQEFYSKQTAEDFHNLKEFYPAVGNLISKEESNMISSIIGSCVPTIIKWQSLANFWHDEKSRLNIKNFIYRRTKYKHIIIRNDATYESIANSVVACFVNVATAFLLDSEYLIFSKKLKDSEQKYEFRFLLDEFNAFAKFLDIPKFNGLNDLGRQAGIRLVICLQRRTQALHFTKNKDLANDFLSTFPNLVICRMATDDVKDYENILGSYKVIETSQSANFNKDGQSSSERTQERDIKNDPLILKNILGPDKTGVFVCIKTVQNPIFAVVKIPFKEVFGKEIIEQRQAQCKASDEKFITNTFKQKNKESKEIVINVASKEVEQAQPTKEKEGVQFSVDFEENLTTKLEQPSAESSSSKEECNEIAKIGIEALTSLADPAHCIGTINTAVEVLEAIEPSTKNTNTLTTEEKLKKLKGRR
ncbi:type IV secretion system DNA-binding domain-containing protein [Delftia sp. JD2]|uniref:type IV secretion system DNA-binding domain-containing protein n=1 Tax=Delftia sp. JD2 TaxID=469553 RepID=UPI000A05F53A|nr:type IV secretion system DNA-binding domain-containing protein [Delftia sp. JD2]